MKVHQSTWYEKQSSPHTTLSFSVEKGGITSNCEHRMLSAKYRKRWFYGVGRTWLPGYQPLTLVRSNASAPTLQPSVVCVFAFCMVQTRREKYVTSVRVCVCITGVFICICSFISLGNTRVPARVTFARSRHKSIQASHMHII